jgi:hypothetical protein
MTITIEFSGYGNEIVVGSISKEDHQKILDYMEKNDMEELSDFFYSDGPDELGITPWHDTDDLVHAYGPNDETDVMITDEDGDILFEGGIMELDDATPLYREETEEIEETDAEEGHKLFFGSAGEEGNWYVEIEIDDDEDFDISKLAIRERNIQTPEEGGMIFDRLTYDGEEYEIELQSSETTGLWIYISEDE